MNAWKSNEIIGPTRPEAGFTLLEVLVAVTILGLTLTVVLQQFSTAMRAGTAARESTIAVLHAREKLEEIKLDHRLSEGAQSGTFDDGYEWETEVQPVAFDGREDDAFEDLKYETFRLRCTVAWLSGAREKRVELSTLKTVRKEKWN